MKPGTLGTRRASRAPLVAGTAALALALACGGEKSVQFGAVLPLTGSGQVYGEALRKGIDLAMEQVALLEDLPQNARVSMVIADSASDPAQAAAKMREVLSDGAIAVIGGVTSVEALEMVKVADDADRVLLSPSASSQELSGVSRNFFRIFPSGEAEAVALANHTVNTLKVTNLAILADASPFGQGLAQGFQQDFERAGGKIAGVLTFEPNTTDLTAQAQQLMELERQAPKTDAEGGSGFAVFVAAAGDDLANALRTLRQQGYESRILASSALASGDVVAAVGQAAEFVYFAQTPFDTTSTEEPMASFVKAYEAKYGDPPGFYAAHGYDAVMVLVQALRQANSAMALDVRNGLKGLADFPGVTGNIQFRDNGDVQRFMRVHLISDGKPRDFEDYMKNRRLELEDRRKALDQQRRELERRLQQGSGS